MAKKRFGSKRTLKSLPKTQVGIIPKAQNPH